MKKYRQSTLEELINNEKNKKMTKLEILEETYKYYTESPSRRGLTAPNSGICEYKTDDGKMCAIGRCLNWDRIADIKYVNMFGGIIGCKTSEREFIQEHFQDKYKGHSVNFWGDVQKWHDLPSHWDKDRLTEEGQNYYDRIKHMWTKEEKNDINKQ